MSEEGRGGGAGGGRKALLRGEGGVVCIRGLEAAVDGWDVLWPPDIAEGLDGLIDEAQSIFCLVAFARRVL